MNQGLSRRGAARSCPVRRPFSIRQSTKEVTDHVLPCLLRLRAMPGQGQTARRLLFAVPLFRFVHGRTDRGEAQA